MNPDYQTPVAERDLPIEARARLRTELLAAVDESGPLRRWAPYAAAAAVAGLAAGGILIAQSSRQHGSTALSPTASTTTAPAVPIGDPAWQRRATEACYQANAPLPGGEKSPGHRHSDMRFFTARTVGAITYVFAGSPAVSLGCSVDAHARGVESAWGGVYTGPGPRAEAVPAGHVDWRTEMMTPDKSSFLIGGQAGAGVRTVRVRWSNGRSTTATVQNGYFIGKVSKRGGPLPYLPNGGELAFTLTAYDKDGHVTQTKTIPAQPPFNPGPKPKYHN